MYVYVVRACVLFIFLCVAKNFEIRKVRRNSLNVNIKKILSLYVYFVYRDLLASLSKIDIFD